MVPEHAAPAPPTLHDAERPFPRKLSAGPPPAGEPRHQRTWSPEALIQQLRPEPVSAERWRDSALTLQPAETIGSRLRRALATPVLVGAAVFVVAVITAIMLGVWNSAGGVTDEGELGIEAGAAADVATWERDAGGGAGEVEGTPGAGGSGVPLWVHVVGEVTEPGLIELSAGARVADALEAAGGATSSAELSGVNLARVVSDGEQIIVPDSAAAPEGALPAPGDPEQVSVNQAAASELEQLPRVGPALAQRIIDWRTENGPFTTVDALLDVPGIGLKTLDGFREQIGL